MILFKDEELADKTKERLEKLTNLELGAFWVTAFEGCADPDRALINLERWLKVTSNPGTHLAHLSETPKLAKLLVDLLGASQSVADGLIQNPELASLITDPTEITRVPCKQELLDEGRSLISAASSYLHKLDRLRFLKQRWRLPIVVNDLAGSWQPTVVWRAISDLADAILELCLAVVWEEYSGQKEILGPCPIMIVAFGKLGGHELNYSSDVDLVYVLADDVDEKMERQAARFCETYGRALSDGMGRGYLYRVDLRLRPFGGAGPVAPTMRSVEAYYRSHAELWEAQALIRTRPIAGGDPSMAERWHALVEANCFKRRSSDFTVAKILETRDRIEQAAHDEDLKRGPGGIRDIEFLVQVLQMVHGHDALDVRVANTVEAIKALQEAGILDQKSAENLVEGYTFLRQIEHRCQLVDDQQTHSIPATAVGREHLGRLMNFGDWAALGGELSFIRRRNRAIYSQVLTGADAEASPREKALDEIHPHLRGPVAAWFDKLPESGEFYRSLFENEGSLRRVAAIADSAPVLLQDLAKHLALTEEIISGEIEEPAGHVPLLYARTGDQSFATAATAAWLRVVARWALGGGENLGAALCRLYDDVLKGVADGLNTTFDVIALGSYGICEAGVESDLDVLFLIADDCSQPAAESQAQEFLAAMTRLKRHGWRKEIDLRLRPEGGKGLLVRSHAGLKTYELERMEMWERFALGNARLLMGNPSSYDVVIKAAYALPLTPERLQELVAMKHRIETERVQPQYWKREVKLGYGGLSDIDWFVHLFEMRYPTAMEVGAHVLMADRLQRMARTGLINAIEHEQLVKARTHLLRTRNFLALLGFTPDVVPENPDKLQKLAKICGNETGYEFLRYHEAIVESVRTIYLEGLERLGV